MAYSKFVVVGVESEYSPPEDIPFLTKTIDGQMVFFGSMEEASKIKHSLGSVFTQAKYKIGRVVLEDEEGFEVIPQETLDEAKSAIAIH